MTSDIIWREVELLKEAGKPVVASFGDYAASGGYYISCSADTIVSMPNTLTGSIGVFSMFPNVSKLMNEKLGVHFDSLKTNPFATGISTVFDLSNQEAQFMQEGTDQIYTQFLQRVADGRNMTVEQVHEVAQGRVWSGEDGIDAGLVDVLGDLDDAIDIAAEMADLDKYSVSVYPRIDENPWREIIKAFDKEKNTSIEFLSEDNKNIIKQYQELSSMLSNQKNMAKLPYKIDFH